jgi:hypothetical protein
MLILNSAQAQWQLCSDSILYGIHLLSLHSLHVPALYVLCYVSLILEGQAGTALEFSQQKTKPSIPTL